MFNPQIVKHDFPIFKRKVHGNKPLIYLDSGATSQKPQVVLDAIQQYYTQHNANVHRGIHVLGDESTKMFFGARKKIAEFFGAHEDELVFTHNTTESLNLIAYSWMEQNLRPGEVILTTLMEHHSNFVPWQEMAKKKQCEFRVVDITADGQLDMQDFSRKLTKEVVVVAAAHVSNALGTINPVFEIIEKAHRVGAICIIDGAQSAPHLPIHFHDLACDFYAFSGHKMLGPMGIGGLLVQKKLLETMPPTFFGGGMINEVSVQKTTFAPLPDKFIAGTPDVASAIGLATACEYLQNLGMEQVRAHDQELVSYALEKLTKIPQFNVTGPIDSANRCGSISGVYQGVHAHDVAQILDNEGVAVRSGHHCTMPLHTHFGWTATTRASFNVYTTKEDIDAFATALLKVQKVFHNTSFAVPG